MDYKSNNDTLNVLFNKKFLIGSAIIGANVFYFNQLQTWNKNGVISRKLDSNFKFVYFTLCP